MPTTLHRRRKDLDASGSTVFRALVVNDSERYRNYVGNLLARFGFEVTNAASGKEAIDALDLFPFDLVAIDLEMPGTSGFELIGTVRSHRLCADAYALMLTTQTDLETKIAALRVGFDDFLTKELSDDDVVAKLGAARRMILRQRRLDATVRELYGLATRDELTGVFNRRYFFTEAERLLAQGEKVSLVLFDLDGFKNVNDTYGHLAGDHILRDVGALFLSRTRHEDIIARYGGDEFVLVTANATVQEVELLAGRLADQVSAMEWSFDDARVRVGVTIGVASSELLQRPTVRQLLSIGDRDLYKNKWVRAHPTIDPSLYEYPSSRANRISELLEFPSKMIDLNERFNE
jgi:diguanylate cyclase (GGDEF)-like protein